MGLLLNAAPSGTERSSTATRSGAGQISGPILTGARPKPGRHLAIMTEMTAQVGRVATRSGGRVRDRTPILKFLAARETNPPVEATAGLVSFASCLSGV